MKKKCYHGWGYGWMYGRGGMRVYKSCVFCSRIEVGGIIKWRPASRKEREHVLHRKIQNRCFAQVKRRRK